MATSFSTAYLTPKERIVAARDTISSNNAARIERAMQIRQLKLDTQAKEVALEQEAASVPKYSTGERIGHTLGDFLGNIAGGVVGFVEGITDFGATVVGGIGSLFDKDFGEDVKQWTERSWTQEEVVNPILEATPGSYINDASETVQNITRGVASGVGQILPAVVISVATAGAGAPAAVANIASLASVGVSAAGRGAEAAFQEGADYGGAIGYGVLSGAVEVAIEKLSGGMGKAFFGKGITDDIVTNVVRKATSNRTAQKGLQILMEAGGEAAEEWASELLNPYLKRMTYDSEAELSTSKERLEAALIGGLSSLAFRGTVGQIGQHSRYAAEEVKNISDADTKEYRLWLDDKLTEGKASEISAFRDSARQNLSSELSKMGSKRRAAFIQQYNLQDMINEDGSLKAQAANESNATVNDALASIAVADRGKISGNIAAEDSSVSAQTVQGAYNKSAYTPSLYGKEDALRYQPTTQTLSSEEVEAKRLFGKFNRGKKRVDLVFVDDMSDVEGNMVNGALYNNVLYINRASGSPIRQLLVHEMTHYARGTREYYKLRDFLLNNVSTENFESIKRKIADAYGIDYNTLVEKNKRYATMSEEEKRAFNSEYSEFDDELVAHIAEDLFSNEESINSIAISSKSFARRIWNWIKDKIKSFGGGKTKAEREAVSILRQAEKLYARALESAVGRRTRGVDSEGEIDSNAEILYNKKTRYIQWKSDALAWANTHSTRIGDMRSGADARFTYFYEAYDPNGDGRATDYRVIAKVSHINQRLINDWYAEVKENNERNHASLYESIDEYGLIRGEHQSDNRTLLEEASTNGRVGGVHQGESEGDGKRTSQKGDGNRKIRYSLSSKQGVSIERKSIRFSLSSDSIKNKKFTREEVRKAFSEIGDLICADENYVIRLQRGKRGETLSFLYNEFNNIDSKNRDAQARKIADFIIARSVAEDIYASDMQGFDIVVYEAVSRYFHQIDLSSQTMRDEINHRFGGAKQARHVYALWSAPKAVRGEGADTIYESIANEIGGLPEVYNEYDAFFAIVDLYERARDSLRQTTEKALNQIMSASELSALREEIADRVLTTYRKYGSETKVHALFRQYAERIDELTRLYKESKTYNQQTNRALDAVRKIAELDGKEFKPASQLNDDRFSALIKKLKKIKWRNELVRPQTRDIIIEYGDTFYNAENPLLEFDYDGAVAQAIDLFRERRRYLQAHKGDNRVILTLDELKALNIVLQNARHMFENYDSFVRNGKRERVTEYATRGVELIDKFAPAQKGDGLLRRIARMGGNFIRQVVDPYTVMRQGDNFYTDGNGNARGVFTELYDDIRASETTAKAKVIELLREQSEFFKKTKGYRKRFNSAHVTIAGKEIPLSVGLSLSLLAKQDSVWNYEDSAGQRVATGLAEDGFGYRNRKGEFVTVGKISKKDVSDMESQFTTEDAEYLKLVRKFFKEGTSPILREAELAMKGYTTVTNEHYFPTRRYEGGIARDTLESPYQSFVGAVRPGFLEARRPRAKGIFDVGNIWKIVNEHAVMSSIYAYMAMPLDAFARVYNKNVAAEGAPVRSMKTAVTERVWSGFNKYVTELLGDITGKNSTRGFGDKLISTLMSNYAKFQLGANPKTVVGQISSYPMAAVRLDVKALMYGIRKVNFKQLDMYCPYAKVRDYEGAIVLAQSMSENIGKVGDVLTKPIQKMDRLTCGLIFNACKYQVQKEQGLKIGTEENLQAAGRLAETVIRDTQSNSVITEKSGLMRSKNGFIRLFTIFSSDAMKQVSRFIQSVGELQAIRRRRRAGEKGVEAQEKKLSKKLGKAVSSILIAQLVFTLVGQAFKSLYDREREDKEGNEISFWEDLARDYLSQIVGLLPVARDMFSFFVEGYEVNAFVYGTINDVLGAVDDTVAVFEKLVSGQATDTPDFMLPLRKSMYAIGQLMGIPVRNIYNVVYGLTKRFAPGSAYKINSLFYDGTLNADLQKAVEEGDNDLAQSIVEVIMNKQGMSDNDAINKKLVELYQAGYNALPRKLGNTVTYDGEEMSLTSRQYARFKEVYSAAEEDVMSLLNDTMFNSLDAAIQAKAIKFVYDYYWYLAIEDLLGEGLNEKKLLYAAAVPIEKLAYIVSYCQSVEEDGRYSRKEIITRFVSRQSGLSSYQKHIIMSYMGYKSTTSEYAIKAYINRLDLTRSQKDAFWGYCGISS